MTTTVKRRRTRRAKNTAATHQYGGDYDTLPEAEDISLLKYSLPGSLKIGSLWVSKFPLAVWKSQRRILPVIQFSPGGGASSPIGSVLIYLGEERQNFAASGNRIVSVLVHTFFFNGVKAVIEKFNTIQPATSC